MSDASIQTVYAHKHLRGFELGRSINSGILEANTHTKVAFDLNIRWYYDFCEVLTLSKCSISNATQAAAARTGDRG